MGTTSVFHTDISVTEFIIDTTQKLSFRVTTMVELQNV